MNPLRYLTSLFTFALSALARPKPEPSLVRAEINAPARRPVLTRPGHTQTFRTRHKARKTPGVIARAVYHVYSP